MKTSYSKFPKIIFLLFSFLTLASGHLSANIYFRAENAQLNGVFVDNSVVTGFDVDGDNVTFVFDASAGLYDLNISYNSPWSDKMFDLEVNGVMSTGTFVGNGSTFTSINVGKVLLNNGTNTLRIYKGWGYFSVEYINLVPSVTVPPIKPSKNLVDGAATPSTKALFSYLVDIYGSKMLAGVAEELDHVVQTTGKEVAVASWDLMDFSPSRLEPGRGVYPTGVTESHIAWAQKGENKGIVSLVWHWNAPADLIDLAPDQLWWRGFYTDATTFDIAAVLADKSSWRYSLILRDIDAIAVELKKYSDSDVPVLFRPLHEASGGWFWWGAKGSTPFKELWSIVYDRIVNYHQLHNLIWVYTGSDDMDWYPGDQYVDIIGLDLYQSANSTMSSDWEAFQSHFNGRKMLSLSETGNLPNPDMVNAYGTWWAYFSNWGGEYIANQPLATKQYVYNHSNVITLDELPNWRLTALQTQQNYTRFESSNVPGHFIRHSIYRGRIDLIGVESDAQFNVVAGLADPNYISLESANFPGYYLRHRNGEIWLDSNDGSSQFKADASWKRNQGLANWTGISFESYNLPGSYIRHSNYQLYLSTISNDLDKADATFFEAGPVTAIIGSTIYKIVSRNSGQCLDVAGGSIYDGANVAQWADNGLTPQQWEAVYVNGYFELVAQCSGKCLDVEGFSNDNGANVSQYSRNLTDNQLWQILPTDGSYFRIINKNSGKVLDVEGFSHTFGANVSQYDDTRTFNQQWQFIAINRLKSAEIQNNTERDFENKLRIYPNPVSNIIYVDASTNEQSVHLALIDLKGNVLIEKNLNGMQNMIDVSGFKNGLYFLQVKMENEIINRKIQIMH